MSGDRVLLLVCGPSGSGKSTLATAILEAEPDGDATIIRQDEYFTQPFVRYRARVDDSYETAEHVDWDALWHNTAAADTTVVVVEGHMVATQHQRMMQLCQDLSRKMICVVLNGSLGQCKQRRLERRVRSEEDTAELAAYIEGWMWPAYLSHGVSAIERMKTDCSGTLVLIDTTDGRTPGEYLHQVQMACTPRA